GLGPDPGEESRMVAQVFHADAAGDHERVEALGDVGKAPLGVEPEARRGAEPAALQAEDFDLVGEVPAPAVVTEPPRRAGEALQRTGDVEDRDVRKGEHRDSPRGGFHAAEDGPDAAWPQCQYAHASCHAGLAATWREPGKDSCAVRATDVSSGRAEGLDSRAG